MAIVNTPVGTGDELVTGVGTGNFVRGGAPGQQPQPTPPGMQRVWLAVNGGDHFLSLGLLRMGRAGMDLAAGEVGRRLARLFFVDEGTA